MRKYPGEYGGSLRNPTIVRDGREHPCFPSPLVFGPFMRFDAEEFREALAEHEAAIDEVADAILFTLRRENDIDMEDLAEPTPLLRWFDFMTSDVAVVFPEGYRGAPRTLFGMKDRATCVARLGISAIKQRLVRAPGSTEVTLVVFTDRAVSAHAAVVGEAPGPGGGTVCSLRRKRLLAVEPPRVWLRPFMGMNLQWTSTPRHWLRVEVNDPPVFPEDADEEMDMLVELYADEIVDDLSTAANPEIEHIGILSSNRRSGDEVLTARKADPFILPSYVADLELPLELARGANPEGWLPVIVKTDKHVGLRWIELAEGAQRARKGEVQRERPADLPARVIPWKRARAVEG